MYGRHRHASVWRENFEWVISPKQVFFFSLPNPDITTMSEDAGFGQRGIFMSLFTVYLSDLTYVSFFAKLYM